MPATRKFELAGARDSVRIGSLTRHAVFRLPLPQRDAAATGDADGDVDSPLDTEARTLQISFSSEEPVDRWFGFEILSHETGAARMGRLNDGAPLLFNHDIDKVVGVVESADIGGDRKGHALVRFARTPAGDEMMGMVADGILRNVSFAYRIHKVLEDVDEETYTATDWEPYEISLVSVPADATVGVGRSESGDAQDVLIERSKPTPAAAGTQKGNDPMKLKHIKQDAAESATSAGGGAATAVDVTNARSAGVEAERQRIASITELGRKHKLDDELVRTMITKGNTIEEARGIALDQILVKQGGQGGVASLGGGTDPDLTEKEKANYSMVRAINACINKDWKGAGFERECSVEIAKRSGRGESQGFYLPLNIPFYTDARGASQDMQQRAQYAVNAAATGGVLVQTNLLAGSFIEILRNRAMVLKLGATLLSGLTGNVDIPRRSGATGTYWVGEGANITESEATFEKVGFTPRTLGAYSIMTRNMLIQGTPDIEMLTRNDFMAVIALGIDLAAISGTGAAGQPLGIVNTSGTGSVVGGANGANITLDNLIDLETQVTAANVPEDTLAYLFNAKTIGSLKKLKATTGQYLWTNNPIGVRTGTPGEINGYMAARSNQMRSTLTKGASGAVCSELIFGAWAELFIAEWGVMEVLPNPYGAGYKSGGVEIRAMQTVDVAPRHQASFAVMSDALTP